MRFLKNKVAKALQQQKESSDSAQIIIKKEETDAFSPQHVDPPKPSRMSFARPQTNPPLISNNIRPTPSKQNGSTKNIVKNFGRAFATFALSDISAKYLESILKQKKLSMEDFRDFVAARKEGIDGISSLREMLLVHRLDKEKLALCKKTFQEISVIFIKFFSVNWIFDSKVGNKIAHVKSRFKMLRRIKNPEYFTYLKASD